MKDERLEKLNEIAVEVLHLSRNTLLTKLRFMDMALSVFELVPNIEKNIATDGYNLVYNPLYVLEIYQGSKEQLVRDYLHIVLHCVFRHMYLNTLVNQRIWDLATDIAVENLINELDLPSVQIPKVDEQKVVTFKLATKLNVLTAEKIYRYYSDKELSEMEYERLSKLFAADDHGLWYKNESSQRDVGSQKGQNDNQEDDDQNTDTQSGCTRDEASPSDGNTDSNSQDDCHNDDDKQQSSASDQDNSANGPSMAEMEERWRDISERMQVDLEAFGKQQGYTAGCLTQNLAELNRERYDYTSFLKKFATLGEAMKINDDEFDYIFYTYGLKLYKNVPLIEPLEYKEVKRVRDLVIAIDTSGSVSGKLVQTFLKKTYNILKSTESFFSKINLHIVQCDTEIQEDVKITSQKEFDRYIKTMKIRGLGGTDFRPVFSYVNQLVEQNEFVDLRGLIYFTDGYGTFPSLKPEYNTAFVFIDDGTKIPEIPPWAIKLMLRPEEI